MGLQDNENLQVQRALHLIAALKKRPTLSFEEALAYCRALLILAANAENQAYAANDEDDILNEMFDHIETALELLDACPAPSIPEQTVEFCYLKATCLLKLDEYGEALQVLHQCDQALQQCSTINTEIKLIQERLPDLLEICEETSQVLKNPQCQPPQYYEERSYLYAILRKEEQTLLESPNTLLSRLKASPDFTIDEFASLPKGSTQYAEHLNTCFQNKEKNVPVAPTTDTILLSGIDHTHLTPEPFSFIQYDKEFLQQNAHAFVRMSEAEKEKAQVRPSLFFTVCYQGAHYEVEIFSKKLFNSIDALHLRHTFTKEEREELTAANESLAVVLRCGENAHHSFKLQVLLITCMFPDVLAIIDESAEQILSGKWARYVTSLHSEIASPMLYTVHAVADDHDVWIHTHGLARFNLPELEILNCSPKHYKTYNEILKAVCALLLHMSSQEKALELEFTPFLLAMIGGQTPITATLVSWPKALKYYDQSSFHGNIFERMTSHNGRSYALFIYKNKKSYDEHSFTPLSEYDAEFDDNAIILTNQEEHEQRTSLAQETFLDVQNFLQHNLALALIEVAIEISDTYIEENMTEDKYEYCWGSYLEEQENGSFLLHLESEPFYRENLHAGMDIVCQPQQVSNWQIQLDSTQAIIQPENAFLLRE